MSPVNGVIAAPVAMASLVRAAEDPAAQIGPGLIAFAIVALLGVATFLLIRSMLYHLKKVPPTFDDQPGSDSSDSAGSSGPADSTGPSDSSATP